MNDYCILNELNILNHGEGENIGPESMERLRMKIALAVGNREAVERLLGDDGCLFDDFYPDMKPPELSTDDTITGFLDQYGNVDEKETDLLTRMIFTPPQSTAGILETADNDISGTAAADDATSSGIASFLAAHAPAATPAPATKSDLQHDVAPETAPSAESATLSRPAISPGGKKGLSLTESLAQVMIRNGNYAKALEIITQLSLSEPKKSIYFADQIRFLKKLIKNQSKIKKD